MAISSKKTKTETKNNEAFAMDAFEMDKMYESAREFSENGIKQNAEFYSRFQNVATDATKAAKETFDVAKNAQENLTSKIVENTKSNIEAGATFAEKLWGIRSVSEMIDFQSTFYRSQFETFSAQAKEIQDISTKAAENAATAGKSFLDKSVA